MKSSGAPFGLRGWHRCGLDPGATKVDPRLFQAYDLDNIPPDRPDTCRCKSVASHPFVGRRRRPSGTDGDQHINPGAHIDASILTGRQYMFSNAIQRLMTGGVLGRDRRGRRVHPHRAHGGPVDPGHSARHRHPDISRGDEVGERPGGTVQPEHGHAERQGRVTSPAARPTPAVSVASLTSAEPSLSFVATASTAQNWCRCSPRLTARPSCWRPTRSRTTAATRSTTRVGTPATPLAPFAANFQMNAVTVASGTVTTAAAGNLTFPAATAGSIYVEVKGDTWRVTAVPRHPRSPPAASPAPRRSSGCRRSSPRCSRPVSRELADQPAENLAEEIAKGASGIGR